LVNVFFEELYAKYRTRMYAIAYALTGNRDASDDLVQETFARAWRSFDTLRDHANFAAWLKTILLNAFRDWLAKKRTASPERPAEPPDPAEIAFRAEERRRIRALIQSMDERERIVLDLSHLQGLSNEDIARALGVTVDHVRVILHRARQNLKKLFERGNP
jgi:RNA polymerase sigma-70 factor (ECF subfamily)